MPAISRSRCLSLSEAGVETHAYLIAAALAKRGVRGRFLAHIQYPGMAYIAEVPVVATSSIALEKAIVKDYRNLPRADSTRHYHQAAHLRRKLKMKKWGFLLLFLLCLGFAFINKTLFFQDKAEIQKYDQNHKDQRGTSESTQTKTISKEQIHQGNLLLINSNYPVRQKSVKSDIVNLSKHNELVKGYGLLDTNIHLSKEIAQKFSEMVNDAAKEGVSHFLINSGYRDFDEQSVLYREMGDDYALPAGFSEHNSGLALDVGSSLTKMEQSPEGKWIKENAWKYGFILRYPKDKTDVTGIQYEPWHIRYVGFPHSAIMKEKNFALEEYLDFLQEQKSITTTIDHQVYKIFYYPISQNTTIPVPANGQYEMSGNNMDGVIVTVYSGKRD